MGDAAEFIENFLMHYSSQYYDPAKAHDYYMRNRELKGRRSASGLKTQVKKEAWAYAKDQISTAKKGDVKKLSETKKASMVTIRKSATERRKAVSDKLGLLLKKIMENKQSEIAVKISSLPPIPKGITKQRHAALAAQRREEIAKIRGEASATAIGNKANEREDSKANREKITTELKGNIELSRRYYKTLRDALVAKYEQRSQTEYDAIRQKA